MTEIVRRTTSEIAAFEQLSPEDQHRVRGLVADSLAASTRRSYESHIAGWAAWCRRNGYEYLPAADATVAAYLSYLAERPEKDGGKVRPSSIKAIRSAIATAHNIAGCSNPTTTILVQRAMQGINRKHQGGRVMNRARAVTSDEVLAMAATTKGDGKEVADRRDAAILLAAYGIAARRSEVVALDVEDLERRGEGDWVAHIRRSKTDQTGEGAEAELVPDVVAVILAWLDVAGIHSGPIFRAFSKDSRQVLPRRLSVQSFNVIAKSRARAAGLDPDPKRGPRISGHSFRRGAATELAKNGGSLWDLQRFGRWRSPNTPSLYVDQQQHIQRLAERIGLASRAPEETN